MLLQTLHARTQTPVEMDPDVMPREILVKFQHSSTTEEREQQRIIYNPQVLHVYRSGVERWRFDYDVNPRVLAAALGESSVIEYAHPNWRIVFADTYDPNDQYYVDGSQWSLKNTGQSVNGVNGTEDADIDADEAWTISMGDPNVIIAVLDNGVDRQHRDLQSNMWTNAAELSGQNNFDDDGNGYIDDKYGLDLVGHNGSLDYDGDPLPWDDNEECQLVTGHGTRVAGIAAGVGDNGIGISGVAYRAKIMAIRFDYNLAQATEAVDYAVDNGADIINASFIVPNCTGVPCGQALYDAMKRARDMEVMVIAAAHNSGIDLDADPNVMRAPATYDLANVITVTSTDPNDVFANHNYGAVSVDLAAPGIHLISTRPRFAEWGDSCDPPEFLLDEPYNSEPGSSFAAPMVAGAAALLRSMNRGMPGEVIRERLLNTVDPNIYSLASKTVTGGRLNVYSAIQGQDTQFPQAISSLSAGSSTTTTINLSWNATGDDGSVGTAHLYHIRHSPQPINEGNFFKAAKVQGAPAPASSGTVQNSTLSGLSSATCYYIALKAYDEWGNGPLSNVVRCGTRPAVCVTDYCKQVGEVFHRCTHNNTFASCGCCQYTCVLDETCTQEDPPPQFSCPAQWCGGL
jgi:subtilisin family serine protease